MKFCTQCKKNKSFCEFGRLKSTKDGRRPHCKECRKKYYLKPEMQVEIWNAKRKERMKQMGISSKGRIVSEETKKKMSLTKRKNFENHDFIPACINRIYKTYLRNGSNILFEKFKEIIFLNCFYCNDPPSRKVYNWDKTKFIEVNGIDRVNNDKDYNESNIVPCCKTCNFAKRDMKVEDFRNWLEKAYNHFIGPSHEWKQ